jgi:hypothetical protein
VEARAQGARWDTRQDITAAGSASGVRESFSPSSSSSMSRSKSRTRSIADEYVPSESDFYYDHGTDPSNFGGPSTSTSSQAQAQAQPQASHSNPAESYTDYTHEYDNLPLPPLPESYANYNYNYNYDYDPSSPSTSPSSNSNSAPSQRKTRRRRTAAEQQKISSLPPLPIGQVPDEGRFDWKPRSLSAIRQAELSREKRWGKKALSGVRAAAAVTVTGTVGPGQGGMRNRNVDGRSKERWFPDDEVWRKDASRAKLVEGDRYFDEVARYRAQ